MNEEAYEEFKLAQQEYLEERFLKMTSDEFIDHVRLNPETDAEGLIMEYIDEHRDEYEEFCTEEFVDNESDKAYSYNERVF